ncbi:hypothetical protein [Endozoicomonas arenosclerae]|uniref:hypothetical protein n=1 Tax=Endozoicomonas arenosclerae TaxID=1633495 RepID=UPI0007831274|nr:hypothetical protein [Endozoicomonas arenosclerae]
MNTRLPLIIALTVFFFIPHAFATDQCSDISGLGLEAREQRFTVMKESFIGAMKPSEHLDQIQALSRDPDLLDEAGDLTLQTFPDIIRKQYPSVPKEVLDKFSERIEELDRVADCYHHGKRNKDALMKLRYRKVKATDSPYIGFLLPKRKDQPRQAKVASAATCYDRQCDFTVKNVDDLDKDIILLVQRPARLSTSVMYSKPLTDPKATATKPLPERAYLLELDLQKVGEYFSKPEIYMQLSYYNGDQLVRQDTIQIPWAKEKGINKGKTELIIWLNADSVQLTLMENDWEIPFRLIGKILSKAVEIGMQLASASHPEIGHIQNALDTLSNRSSSEAPDFYDALDRMNADDLLDTVRLQRTNQGTYMPMKKGVVKMTLKHDYTPKTRMRNEL